MYIVKKKEKKNISVVFAFDSCLRLKSSLDTCLTAEEAASPRGGEKQAWKLCKRSTLTSCDFDQWLLLRRSDSFDLCRCEEFSAAVQTAVWLRAELWSRVAVDLNVRVAHGDPLGIKL